MNDVHELIVAKNLATVLAHDCHEGCECPAEKAGMDCPFFGVPCMEVTPAKWHVWAKLLKEPLHE